MKTSMWVRRGAAVVGGAVAVGLAGTLSGPRWRPKPLERPLLSQDLDTVIVPGQPKGTSPVYGVDCQLKRLPLGQGDTIVEVSRPRAPGRFPAVIFAHGAGTGNHTAFAEHVAALAARGIVCLVPDKQLATYTSFYRDYEAMGREFADLATWARQQDWVEPSQVGYWGESESGWITPVAAGLDPDCAFMLFVSAPIVRPREQGMFSACAYLRNTGVPEGMFHAVPRLLGGPMPAGRINYADWDVEPYLNQISCPVFVAYGTQDTSVPLIQGALEIIDAARQAGNEAVTVRYYDANHGLRVGQDQRIEPRFLTDVGDWILGLPGTGAPARAVAGPQPRQPFWVIPAPPVAWFGRLTVQAGLAVGSVALAAGGPLLRALGRLMGHKPTPLPQPLRVPQRVFVGGALASTVGFAAYVARVVRLATTYRRDPITVVGGYQAVRALAAASVAGGVLLAFRLGDVRANSDLEVSLGAAVRLAVGAAGAAGLLLFGSYWGILPLEPRSDDIPR